MTMNIILLGQGPLPSEHDSFCTFPQLRTWSMLQFLRQHTSANIDLILLNDGTPLASDGDHKECNVYSATDMKSLYEHVQNADAIVTAGPFLPLIALLHIPTHIPVWLDYPSDPLADRECKHKRSNIPHTEYNFITELVQFAMHRADAMGVISRRQSYASLGQRLLLDCASIPIQYVPIAFEFPHAKSSPQKTTNQNALLSGSNNSWLDIQRLESLLGHRTVHCTGMDVQHIDGTTIPDQWNNHGWLTESDLQKIIEQCSFGVWADATGNEPILGSRTRALFYIWCGLTPIGDGTTELAEMLIDQGCMNSWSHPNPFSHIDIEAAQQFCADRFAPSSVYTPLLNWLERPTLAHRTRSSGVEMENLKLRAELQTIYETKTWRWGSKLHRLYSRAMSITQKK